MEKITDEEIKKLEAEISEMENTEDSFTNPTPEKKDSTLVLFRELISSPDSKKFGNLSVQELGTPSMSVRKEFDIANYLETEGLSELSNYFKRRAEITLATSLSKKGKLIDNIVTQIKKEQKVKDTPEQKKSFFNFGGKKTDGESE